MLAKVFNCLIKHSTRLGVYWRNLYVKCEWLYVDHKSSHLQWFICCNQYLSLIFLSGLLEIYQVKPLWRFSYRICKWFCLHWTPFNPLSNGPQKSSSIHKIAELHISEDLVLYFLDMMSTTLNAILVSYPASLPS